MQPKNARAGTLFTLKSAKSRPKEREIFSGADNEAAPSARRPYTTFLWETMRSWKQRTGAVEHLDCRSVSDLMRPEIIPHSYMGNTLYDLCRLWRLTVPLANAPAALECRAHGQDLKFFFFSIRIECVIIFASFSLGPMMFYCMQITTGTVVSGYNWL